MASSPKTGGRSRSAGRPTLDQVAVHAGVGRGTVSRVVNGSPQVSPSAREAVERAIAELGYVPNRAARALVTQRTDSVALVVSESEERVFGQPFFAGIVRGISLMLAETALQLWLVMAQSGGQRDRLERHLTSQHVDGILLVSVHDDDPLPGMLAGAGVPVVIGGRTSPMLAHGTGPVPNFVDVDNLGGARLATEHLLAIGRRRVATITGPLDMGAGVTRLEGYRAAMGTRTPIVVHGDFSEEGGMRAARELLAAHPDVDAIFAASDPMALGLLRVLREQGKRVPEDVAVVGFDDSFIASQTDPPLTTVHQPIESMGRAMAQLLYDKIRGIEPPHPHLILGTHLVRRRSA